MLQSRRMKTLAARGGHHDLGYSSPSAFLVDQTKVTPAHARRIVAFGNAAERAPSLDAVDTAKAVAYWRQTVEEPGTLDPLVQQEHRGLHLSETTGGMRRVDGWLTPTAGAALEAALDANTPPRREDDTRTPRQRRPRKPMPRLARQRHHPHHRRRKTPHRLTHRPESTPRRRRRTPRNRKRTNHRRRHPENDRL
jgi:hypothetical protein